MDNLNKDWFAYPSMRKYPVHTKEAALHSFQEFSDESFTIPKALSSMITGRFEKAAAFHEIELKPLEKTAAATPDTILFEGKTGDISISKITSLEAFREATDYILEKRATMHRADLQEAAKYVVWTAANSDMAQATPELQKVAKIAGIGVGDRAKIQHAFEKRATLCVLSDHDSVPFWSYAKELRGLTDEEFYKEATLNKICNTIEEIDEFYNNKARYGKDLEAPEDVVFESNMDDLLKEASDLMYIPSVDATLSKKALLQRKEAVQAFFNQYLAAETAYSDVELIEKVASLDHSVADHFLAVVV